MFSCKNNYKEGSNYLMNNDFLMAYRSFSNLSDKNTKYNKKELLKAVSVRAESYYNDRIDKNIKNGDIDLAISNLGDAYYFNGAVENKINIKDDLIINLKKETLSYLDKKFKEKIESGDINSLINTVKKYSITLNTKFYNSEDLKSKIIKTLNSVLLFSPSNQKIKEILRKPEKNIGKIVCVNGEVFQDIDDYNLLMTSIPAMLGNYYEFYTHDNLSTNDMYNQLLRLSGEGEINVWVNYKSYNLKLRENDYVRVYGKFAGEKEYQTTSGDTRKVMEVDAIFWVVFDENGDIITSIDDDLEKFDTEIENKIASKTKQYLVTVNNLRLRKSPGADGEFLAFLKEGEKVIFLEKGSQETINDIKGNWIKVKTDSDKIGWCFDGYLKKL